MHRRLTSALAVAATSAMTLLPVYPASAQSQDGSSTKTPIKHVVVIFQENVSSTTISVPIPTPRRIMTALNILVARKTIRRA